MLESAGIFLTVAFTLELLLQVIARNFLIGPGAAMAGPQPGAYTRPLVSSTLAITNRVTKALVAGGDYSTLQSWPPIMTGTLRQGLTLVHFSAQPEPFLTQNTP